MSLIDLWFEMNRIDWEDSNKVSEMIDFLTWDDPKLYPYPVWRWLTDWEIACA